MPSDPQPLTEYTIEVHRPRTYAEDLGGPWVAEVFLGVERVVCHTDCWTRSGALRWARRQARRHAAGKLERKPDIVERFTP